jgi:hypothetical protein
MAGYVLYAVMLRVGYQPSPTTDDADLAIPPIPVTTSAPEPTDEVEQGLGEPSPISAANAPPEPTAAPPEPDPPPATGLAGEYGIEESYEDVFIGRVTIVNGTDRAEDWTVELAFPSSIGALNTFWVDGTPQPTLRESADRYIFTSTVPVEAESQVILKFHFDRQGRDIQPTTCTSNGVACG